MPPKAKLQRPLQAQPRLASWTVKQVMMKSLDEGSLRLIFLRWHRLAFKADRVASAFDGLSDRYGWRCAAVSCSVLHGQERRQKQILLFRQESEAVGIIFCHARLVSKQGVGLEASTKIKPGSKGRLGSKRNQTSNGDQQPISCKPQYSSHISERLFASELEISMFG